MSNVNIKLSELYEIDQIKFPSTLKWRVVRLLFLLIQRIIYGGKRNEKS